MEKSVCFSILYSGVVFGTWGDSGAIENYFGDEKLLGLSGLFSLSMYLGTLDYDFILEVAQNYF